MKKLLLLLFLSFAIGTSAQRILKTEKVSEHSTYIKGNNFEGVAFSENYVQNPKDTAERKIKRFTPTNADIILTERVLKEKRTDTANKGDIKYIFNNLSKYHRQYIGYYNEKGEKMIYVNCFPVDDDWANEKIKKATQTGGIPKWYDHLFYVFDGGRSYWHATILLTKKIIVNISVNGVA
jgi:hypothetical protein